MDAIQLDTKIIFKVSRQPDDLLSVVFYDVNEFPLDTIKNISISNIDRAVSNFRPECEKIQILAYPSSDWFKNGCPETRYARKIH